MTPFLLYTLAPAFGAGGSNHGGLAGDLAAWHVLPFVGLLLCIAILPMVAHTWFDRNRHKLLVALGWSAPVLLLLGYPVLTGAPEAAEAGGRLLHALEEYGSFIALLGSLFVISGGIYLRGDLQGRPSVNTAFLAVGALIANLVGTTGASMLLIRPMLRTNRQRRLTLHIPLFFIFLVSNVGGALTPIGDPPLFLGYLRGVPFFWTVEHVWPIWAFAVGLLLAVFFAIDTWCHRREAPADVIQDQAEVEPLGFDGKLNFLLLGGVIAAVLLLSPGEEPSFRDLYAREIAMVALAAASVLVTPRAIRARNAFTYGPILEVAALFLGIFVTMIPATMLLEARGAALGVTEPWQYFWATGALSSFLDNAPTYVTFAALACGSVGAAACPSADQLGALAMGPGMPLLLAVSTGAVFMGANSYIGNGPNFMVRAIAVENGYRMPSFFGYMGWAAAILLPVFGLVTVVFFLG